MRKKLDANQKIILPLKVITPDSLDRLTETIHYLRFENNLSLEKFSEKTGLPVDQIMQLEAGIVQTPKGMVDLTPFVQIAKKMKDRFIISLESGS